MAALAMAAGRCRCAVCRLGLGRAVSPPVWGGRSGAVGLALSGLRIRLGRAVGCGRRSLWPRPTKQVVSKQYGMPPDQPLALPIYARAGGAVPAPSCGVTLARRGLAGKDGMLMRMTIGEFLRRSL